MKIPLSNRLRACIGFISPGSVVADIGCDHGYLGIYLLTQGIATRVIAADINEQPLKSAVRNAEKFGVTESIQFFLSNGAANIPREFDTMVCAGMGADTMISILEQAHWLRDPSYCLILQCQSRRPELRRYLSDKGFAILEESLAEDGKFIYPVMRVRYEDAPALTPGGCHISPALLASCSPLLPEFYQRVKQGISQTLQGLSRSGGEKLIQYKLILDELEQMEETIYGNRC